MVSDKNKTSINDKLDAIRSIVAMIFVYLFILFGDENRGDKQIKQMITLLSQDGTLFSPPSYLT